VVRGGNIGGRVAAGVAIAPGQGQLEVASASDAPAGINHTCDFRTRSFTHQLHMSDRNIDFTVV
jgi:hypothetical protein